jgi:hypothetical protein
MPDWRNGSVSLLARSSMKLKSCYFVSKLVKKLETELVRASTHKGYQGYSLTTTQRKLMWNQISLVGWLVGIDLCLVGLVAQIARIR